MASCLAWESYFNTMSLRHFLFKLPFNQPLITAKGTFSVREGLLISATIGGNTYWSEVSPLPGFSVTTLEECIEWFKVNSSVFWVNLLDRYSKLTGQQSILGTIESIASVDEPDFPASTPPEICFAFDTLLLQSMSQKSNINPDSKFTIGVNATASDLITAQSKVQNGYKTIKLKVGLDWPSEVNTILILRSQYPDIKLRLDANEAWSVGEASLRLLELQNLNIEYIEQPVNQIDLLKNGSELRLLGTPIAADESSRSMNSIHDLIHNHSADVFILKPPMLGSFKKIQEACTEIRSAGYRMIFTSSLDSSLNVATAALLASFWANPEDLHGFSTGSMFEKNINPNKSKISDSKLTLDTSWILNPNVILDKSLLTELY